jgi:DNA-binding Lrp family transcriptional regulator
MKDSRRSDARLARVLGVSQPTVTRKRANLERNVIEGYTAVPKFDAIGFEIVAFTFVKSQLKYAKREEKTEARGKAREWIMKQPNCVLALNGEGMGWDGMCISFHKDYSDYMEFKRRMTSEFSDWIQECQSFIAETSQKGVIKPFHFKYLAQANRATEP